MPPGTEGSQQQEKKKWRHVDVSSGVSSVAAAARAAGAPAPAGHWLRLAPEEEREVILAAKAVSLTPYLIAAARSQQ